MTQKNFDPIRYQGKWNEVARYPSLVWEEDCETAEANYIWDSQNMQMLVENVCLDAQHTIKRKRSGRAIVSDPKDKSKLMLKFTDGLPSGPESPYWVIKTDYDNYSIVSGSTNKYLWVLTRSPTIQKNDIAVIKQTIAKFGFNPEKLVFSQSRIK